MAKSAPAPHGAGWTVKVPEMETIFSVPEEIRSAFGFVKWKRFYKKSFIAGLERLVARTDLLDSINVFPVADGDTGRNLPSALFHCAELISLKKNYSSASFIGTRQFRATSLHNFFLLFALLKTSSI